MWNKTAAFTVPMLFYLNNDSSEAKVLERDSKPVFFPCWSQVCAPLRWFFCFLNDYCTILYEIYLVGCKILRSNKDWLSCVTKHMYMATALRTLTTFPRHFPVNGERKEKDLRVCTVVPADYTPDQNQRLVGTSTSWCDCLCPIIQNHASIDHG